MQSTNLRQIGKRYEELALAHLTQAGLQFITANFYSPFGEIDLIMRDNKSIVFVEVRFRSSAHFGNALQSITARKQEKLIQTAHYWLLKENISFYNTDYRFDVFAITGNQIEWLQNAVITD